MRLSARMYACEDTPIHRQTGTHAHTSHISYLPVFRPSSPNSLLVSLSAFLVIGSTSALTYNVSSHLKTVLIMAGGVLLFGDAAHPAKLAGLTLAMAGIIVYSVQK